MWRPYSVAIGIYFNYHHYSLPSTAHVPEERCVCVCVRACMCVCVWGGGHMYMYMYVQ